MWFDAMEIEHNKVNVLSKTLSMSPEFYVNCGGHAFGVDGWYSPSKLKDNWSEYHTTGKNHWRNLERKYVKNILRDFPGLRLANKSEIDNLEIDLDEFEIIAFRICREPFFCDYHFMKCERNGDWTEKQGTSSEILHHNYEDIYDIWGRYDGRLYFFVRKRVEL